MSRVRKDVALICVVGPDARELLAPLVEHYEALGVTEFRIALHMPETTSTASCEDLERTCADLVGRPDIVSRGEWRVGTNGGLRDRLRGIAASDWHVLADADEFHTYPLGIREEIDRRERAGTPFATGLLVDRITRGEGSAVGKPSTISALDNAFPLGSFITPRVLRGDPRKITLARRDVALGSGNHHTPSHLSFQHPAPAPVHHFKWRAGVLAYLVKRARGFAQSADPSERSMRQEALRAIELLKSGTPTFGDKTPTFPASVRQTPDKWAELSTPIWDYWQFQRWGKLRT